MSELERGIPFVGFLSKEKFCFLLQIMDLRGFLGIIDIPELQAEAYFLLKSLSHSLWQSPEENID